MADCFSRVFLYLVLKIDFTPIMEAWESTNLNERCLLPPVVTFHHT
jgi:hypothetical protein